MVGDDGDVDGERWRWNAMTMHGGGGDGTTMVGGGDGR